MAYLFDDYAGRVVLRGVGSYMGIRANLNVDVKKSPITPFVIFSSHFAQPLIAVT